MKVITLFGNRTVQVSDSEGTQIQNALESAKPPRYFKIRGQSILTTDITGVFDVEVWEDQRIEASGGYKCPWGHWHPKDQSCSHGQEEIEPIDLSYFREGRDITGEATESAKQWLKIGLINNKHKIRTGKYGTLSSLAELAEYEKTGEMPEPKPGWGMPSKPPAVSARWCKKRITERQYEREYAHRQGYWVLNKDGTDIDIAYSKLLTPGWSLRGGEQWCSEVESRNLTERMRPGH